MDVPAVHHGRRGEGGQTRAEVTVLCRNADGAKIIVTVTPPERRYAIAGQLPPRGGYAHRTEDHMADRIISCDDHMDLSQLPADLWTTRLPASLLDRAPHIEERDGQAVWVCDGKA